MVRFRLNRVIDCGVGLLLLASSALADGTAFTVDDIHRFTAEEKAELMALEPPPLPKDIEVEASRLKLERGSEELASKVLGAEGGAGLSGFMGMNRLMVGVAPPQLTDDGKLADVLHDWAGVRARPDGMDEALWSTLQTYPVDMAAVRSALEPIELTNEADAGQALAAFVRAIDKVPAAQDWLEAQEDSADALYFRAMLDWASGDETREKVARKGFIRAFEQGSAAALTLLGEMTLYGDRRLGIEPSRERTRKLWTLAADNGSDRALWLLVKHTSVLDPVGRAVQLDPERVSQLQQQLCALDTSRYAGRACAYEGSDMAERSGWDADEVRDFAVDCWRRLRHSGCASMIMSHLFAAEDETEAFALWARRTYQLNDANWRTHLEGQACAIISASLPVPKIGQYGGAGDDYTTRWSWCAYQEGLPSAFSVLSNNFLHGMGVAPSRDMAYEMLMRGIAAADPLSTIMMAFAYLDGHYGEKDPEKEFYWYQRAAELGVTRAVHYIGNSYGTGSGVEQDFEKAYVYIQLAIRRYNGSDPAAETQARTGLNSVLGLLKPDEALLARLDEEVDALDKSLPPPVRVRLISLQ